MRNLRRWYLEERFVADRKYLLFQLNDVRRDLSKPYDQELFEPLRHERLVSSYRNAERMAKNLSRLSRRLGYNETIVSWFREMANEQREERKVLRSSK